MDAGGASRVCAGTRFLGLSVEAVIAAEPIQRAAWFHIFIEAEDEAIASLWMNTVNSMLDACAKKAAEASNGKIKLLSAMESGQSIPVVDEPPKKRSDV